MLSVKFYFAASTIATTFVACYLYKPALAYLMNFAKSIPTSSTLFRVVLVVIPLSWIMGLVASLIWVVLTLTYGA